MKTDNLFFASTHFYFTENEAGEVKVSVQGNLYSKGGDVNYDETEEFQSQLEQHLKSFVYVNVPKSDVESDKLYMEAMERASKLKGYALAGNEIYPFYGYYIMKETQNEAQMQTIIDYITQREYLLMTSGTQA